jgi:ParB family chromosome partitioning protein
MSKLEDVRKGKRLGRGLSGLIGEAVSVQVSDHSLSEAEAAGVDDTREGGITMVAVGEVRPSPFQPRREFDRNAMDRLADSIKRSGVMQPVIVRPRQGGGYELVAGERRWRAAGLAGLGRLPAIVRHLTDEQSAEWALVENVQREDLNAIERAQAFASLVERFGLTHSEIAERVGMDRTSVANTLRLLDLEPQIQQLIIAGRLNMGHGKALLLMPAGGARVTLAEHAANDAWTVRRLEREVRAIVYEVPPTPSGQGPIIPSVPRSIDHARMAARASLEKQLGEHLASRVVITTDRTGVQGRLVIEFYSIEHFDGLLAKLGFVMR